MTENEVIELARKVAEGWAWKQPIRAKCYYRRWINKTVIWEVWSNANFIGQNVAVRIDDATGQILSKGFSPR